MKKNTYRSVIAVLTATGLTACASGPKKVDFPADTNPQAKIGELKDRLSADQGKQYDELSPEHFEMAKQSLNDAQHDLDQGKSSTDILNDAGKAAANLDLVEQNAAKYGNQLKPIIQARQYAITAKAPQNQSEEFASADKDFRDFGSDLESKGSTPESSDISKLEAKYSNLELKAVKSTTLGEASTILNHANKRDAQSKAPKTYDAAQMKYDTALRAIEADRRNPSSFQPAVNESLTSARKLDQVMNTIEMSKTSEDVAVKMYDQQQQIASTQQTLAQTKAQADAQAAAAQSQIDSQRQTVNTLQSQNTQYADKAALNKKIETVKAEFSPEEADVLRDGKKIILRLKKMQFSTARAELTQSSIQTLQKVKDMIAAVPFSAVEVEGHTDNVGGEQKNMALSEKRADAVKNYLISENSVSSDKIEAKGYGYEKPLTSNKTAAGRATNRRVDVVIDTDADL